MTNKTGFFSNNNQVSYYTIITNTGIMYDEDGEAISPSKISQLIASKRCSIKPCQGLSERDIQDAYRQSALATLTYEAVLVVMQSSESFDYNNFTLLSCELFETSKPSQLPTVTPKGPNKSPSCLIS